MDPSPNPNWLVFSLSNNSLFHSSFNSNSSSSGGFVDQENAATAADHHHLAVLGSGGARPKLENFLGGAGGSSDAAAQFDGGAQGVNNVADVEIYDDSELKSIAAGFLGGFCTDETQKQPAAAAVAPPPPDPPARKTAENFGHRTSIFRGVTRHRWTGRYEAHLWDNTCRREGQSRKGRQVYLGGYDKEEKAARAYDLAALKYWGPTTTTNFPVSDYERELEEMKHMTRQEFVASLRRKSSGFSRGASIYRGVTRHHQHGRWQARIGRVAGNKDLYLGTFSTQEEAAEAYDIAAIKFRGLNAVTNFDMSRYDVRSIASSNLPVGGVTNKPKTSSELLSENKSVDAAIHSSDDHNNNKLELSSATSVPFSMQNSPPALNFDVLIKQDHQSSSSSLWAALGYQNDSSGTTVQGPTPYSMGLQADLSINGETEISSANEGFFDGCGNYYQHQDDGTTTSSPEERTTNNWLAPPPSVVRSLSAFQTPIFGME